MHEVVAVVDVGWGAHKVVAVDDKLAVYKVVVDG